MADLPSAAARPIQPERPEGADATYDDAFLAIRARIDALGTLGGGIDHERVLAGDADSVFDATDRAEDFRFIVQTGTRLLLHRTKDLRIGCYVTLALVHTEGLRGLRVGLKVLSTLVSGFGEALYPRRARARNAALTFLATRLGDVLDSDRASDLFPASQETVDAFDASLNALRHLQDALSEHVDAYASGLAPLERRLSDARRARSRALSQSGDRTGNPEHDHLRAPTTTETFAPETLQELDRPGRNAPQPKSLRSDSPQPDPAKSKATDAKATEAEATVAEAAEAEATVEAEGSAPNSPAESADQRDGDAPEPVDGEPPASWSAIVQMTGHLREANRSDPRPYDILRCVRWGRVHTAPDHRNGVTQIEPPPRRRRERLRRMMRTADTRPAIDTAIDHAEDAFQEPPFHFWLSLQHDLLQAMERAGDAFTPTRASIRRRLHAWVDRVPSIAQLSFADGTPFADDDTRRWLRSLARRSSPEILETACDALPDANVSSAPLHRSVSRARRALHAAGLTEALDALEADTRVRGERGLLLLRLMKGRLCLDAGRPSLARAILEAIDRRLRASPSMLAYDPDLAIEVWHTLRRCYDHVRSHLLHPDADNPADVTPSLTDLDARIQTVRDHIAAHAPERTLREAPQ